MTRNRPLVTVLAASLSMAALAAVLVPTFAQEPAQPPAGNPPGAPANPAPATTAPATLPVTATNAPQATQDVYEVAKQDRRLRNFIRAIDSAGLKSMLKEKGPFTILAPTDRAFSRMAGGAWTDLRKPENHEKLVSIMKLHILPVRYTAADLAKLTEGATVGTSLTANSLKVTNSGGLKFNGVSATTPEIAASNGTIIVIDKVLLPADTTVPVPPPVPSNKPVPTAP